MGEKVQVKGSRQIPWICSLQWTPFRTVFLWSFYMFVCFQINVLDIYIYSLNSLLFLALGNGILFPYSGSDPYVTKIASKRMSLPIEIEWSVWMVSLGLLCVCLSGLNYIKHGLILVTYHHSYIKNSNSLIEQETSCRGHIGIFVL